MAPCLDAPAKKGPIPAPCLARIGLAPYTAQANSKRLFARTCFQHASLRQHNPALNRGCLRLRTQTDWLLRGPLSLTNPVPGCSNQVRSSPIKTSTRAPAPLAVLNECVASTHLHGEWSICPRLDSPSKWICTCSPAYSPARPPPLHWPVRLPPLLLRSTPLQGLPLPPPTFPPPSGNTAQLRVQERTVNPIQAFLAWIGTDHKPRRHGDRYVLHACRVQCFCLPWWRQTSVAFSVLHVEWRDGNMRTRLVSGRSSDSVCPQGWIAVQCDHLTVHLRVPDESPCMTGHSTKPCALRAWRSGEAPGAISPWRLPWAIWTQIMQTARPP